MVGEGQMNKYNSELRMRMRRSASFDPDYWLLLYSTVA